MAAYEDTGRAALRQTWRYNDRAPAVRLLYNVNIWFRAVIEEMMFERSLQASQLATLETGSLSLSRTMCVAYCAALPLHYTTRAV